MFCFYGQINSFVSGTWSSEGRIFLLSLTGFFFKAIVLASWLLLVLTWEPDLQEGGAVSVQLLCLAAQAFLSSRVSQSKSVHWDSLAQIKWDGQRKTRLQFLLVPVFYTLIKVFATLQNFSEVLLIAFNSSWYN